MKSGLCWRSEGADAPGEGSDAVERLKARLKALLEPWRARSLRRRVARLHIKLDRLAQRVELLAPAPAQPEQQPEQQPAAVDKGTQLLLSLKYRELAAQGVMLPLPQVEFSNFSQSGEDGILHYIFSLIGTRDRRAVELCAGAGSECNSANLIVHHGWHALLVDGSERNVREGRAFFARQPATRVNGPVFAHAWVDRDSVNDLLERHGFSGEIDLLSLDLDGVDYWIWEAIRCVSPRVVVVEANLVMSASSVTVPYSSDFRAEWVPLRKGDAAADAGARRGRSDFCSRFAVYAGASLPAFVKLAKTRGYRLIGSNGIGYNAFFLRDDVGRDLFPEVSAESCINPDVAAHSPAALEALRDRPWQAV